MTKLRVVMFRHAPRESGGDTITAAGTERARTLGARLSVQFPNAVPVGLCSDKVRTQQTLLAMLEGMGAAPTPAFQQEPALQNQVSPAFDDLWTRLEGMDPNAGVEMYLRYGDQRPDPESLSPREVAERVAILIRGCLPARAEDATSASPCVVMVTHSGIIELFLATLLHFESVAAMSGIVDYLESVELTIGTDATDATDATMGGPDAASLASAVVSFQAATYIVDDGAQQWLIG